MDTQLRHSRPRLELGWGAIAKCRVTPPLVVEHLNVLEDILGRILTCAVLALVDELALERAEKALHAGVVPTVSPARHTSRDAKRNRDILHFLQAAEGILYACRSLVKG